MNGVEDVPYCPHCGLSLENEYYFSERVTDRTDIALLLFASVALGIAGALTFYFVALHLG